MASSFLMGGEVYLICQNEELEKIKEEGGW